MTEADISQDLLRYPSSVAEFITRLRRDAWETSYTYHLSDIRLDHPMYPELSSQDDTVALSLQREGHTPFDARLSRRLDPKKPLLVMNPGYEGTLRCLPEELSQHFNTLMVSPLGYSTPDGGQRNEYRSAAGNWPVLADTIRPHGENRGYDQWLLDALTAIRCCEEHTEASAHRIVFAGCSQGGAMSLLLGSILKDRCMAICADEPFLVGCSGEARLHDFISSAVYHPWEVISTPMAQRHLQCVDPLCHAPLLEGVPVLVCSGELDTQCPAYYNEQLFAALPPSKEHQYLLFEGRPHGYSARFHRAMLTFLAERGLLTG